MIHLNDIHFIREERHILQDVSFHAEKGEHWVLLGKNGSGKTTLLELMNGYQFPSRGKVEVLGNRYGQVDVREVRKRIGYISQSLFEKMNLADTVWEAVATGEYAYLRFYQEIPEDVKKKAIGMLERIGLPHVAMQSIGTLSQGERKKVMLARSMMQKPELLIMDEPCSGLDLYEREKLLAAIREFSDQDMTVLYVTHHIEEIIPMFTHVALIEQGRIIAAGPKEEVLTPEHLYQAFQVPLEVEWFRNRPWIKVL
ncbi:ABC transporter ATP-binding protein [Paenibacillus chitinolyticus]|uniref:ATP-binding cassette domain-containing protein n=1 Tax=Paenibacillus chitinolyticus TaxID=79263 RepID=A0A410WVX2_9BACL|nr:MULTISPECIES: ATP-binding cassette domain-containing protein [Paenibacillus]MCY9592808.1 ATP-binding cassette domain-containing protein [Paenibacillus chitinolyticus]MCY9597590.1 ATP-binding cassette domain-containing protein [Paenibacillus chitinolyticus]QAV18579.1 molybdenum ABC transporter ATP-binding protein [Paenibacillus chitinolyticus]GKS11450.1 putative ABC transporter ATP-binding protein YlmA [Paenibacillus chitinolyticus]